MIWTLLMTSLVLALSACLVVPPILKAWPKLQASYTAADTSWRKAKALTWNSMTIAWSYVMLAIGFVMQQFDNIAGLLGDPDLKANLSTVLGADTRTLGYMLLGISMVTLVSRLRSLKRGG
jgi:hypothetical protein